jgi:hypothetical protein
MGAIWLLVSPISCESGGAPDISGDGGTDGDADSDTDNDVDTDTDSDTDTDLTDTDGDSIADSHEGKDAETDTDGDDIPDYLDDDSDGDGIPDSIEAGDDDVSTPPVDTDDDGIPDFQDNDSDQDGIADGDEDINGNGELDPGETDPYDDDSDDDGVSDLVEEVAGTDPLDPDDNPLANGNFVFLVPYQDDPEPLEGEIRFQTAVSKVDMYFLEDISVSMEAELLSIYENMVTVLDDLTCDLGESFETCADDCPDTCGDASCDAGEDFLNCPVDCLGTCGDLVCIGNENPDTCPEDCPGDICGEIYCCGDGFCDAEEDPASCSTDCPGTCGDGFCNPGEQAAFTGCIEDLWSGAGVFGTASDAAACHTSVGCPSGDGNFVYQNLLDLQPDPVETQNAVPSACWGQPCWEPPLAATFYAITGYGSVSATADGFTMPPLAVPEPPACPPDYFGTPCFRPDSLPIILIIGDEPFRECYLPDGVEQGDCVAAKPDFMDTPDFPIVSNAVNMFGAKVVGIMGNANATNEAILQEEMETLCTQTGSVDELDNPFVFHGADADAADAIADGIKTLTGSIPLDMLALAQDDDADLVDAVEAFVDYLEVYTPGTQECIDWSDVADSNDDTHPDEFLAVTAGLPVCWKIVVQENQTVEPLDTVQLFKAFVHLWGNDTTLLDTRTVYFVVPPDVSSIDPE